MSDPAVEEVTEAAKLVVRKRAVEMTGTMAV